MNGKVAAAVVNTLNQRQQHLRAKRRRQRLRRRLLKEMVPGNVMQYELKNEVLNSSGIPMRTDEGYMRHLKTGLNYGVLPNIKLGSTQAGRLAALKALHPAMEIGPQPWPDENTSNTIRFENRDVFDLPNPARSQGDWNANVYITSFPDCPLLITTWHTQVTDVNNPQADQVKLIVPTGGWESANWLMLYSNPYNAEGSYPGDDFQTIRVTARSVTAHLVATALENKGTIYAGQFAPDVTYSPLAATTVAAMAVRHMVKLLIKGGSDLPFEEMLTNLGNIEEVGDLSGFEGDQVDGVVGSPPVDETGFHTVYQKLPNEFQELAELDPKYFQDEAKHGVYLPLHITASSNMNLINTAHQYHLNALKPRPNGDNAGRWGHHVCYGDNFNMGVIMFRNIQQDASINFKVISDIEATPLPGSIMTKLAQPAPDIDQLACNQTSKAMSRMPSAFPACANSLGTILDSVGGALAGSGIPILSSIGKLTQTKLGKSITGAL